MAMPPETDLAVTLHLSQAAQRKLAERASASGQDLANYISTLVETVVDAPRSLEEISGKVYQRFLESGTTDDQLSEELERAKA